MGIGHCLNLVGPAGCPDDPDVPVLGVKHVAMLQCQPESGTTKPRWVQAISR